MPSSIDLPARSCAYLTGQPRPDQSLIDLAVTATVSHPLAVEAMSHVYCHAIVMREPTSFLTGTKFPELPKVLDALSNTDAVLVVSYRTSTSKPEPLAGGGRTFDFLLHPVTFEILQAAIGTWKS